MTYPETLQYLYTQLPMFTRDGASAFKKDLTNTLALCAVLGNPQHKFKSIHIGGTNGKGSTSHMLAAILQTAGYKTGLYTSPHLKDFRERIRINGEMIAEPDVVDFVTDHQADFERIQPSFFEMTVALAFEYFAKNKVDVAIIEVGLGGRLDSTNVITPQLSVITNIGWDHMNMLGNTLQLIAGEKAGIIKPNVPVIIGEFQPEVAAIFQEKASNENAPLRFASELWHADFKVKAEFLEIGVRKQLQLLGENEPLTSTYQLDLRGTYQVKNLKTVLSAVEVLREKGYQVTEENLRSALKNVTCLTGLMGRWQTLSQKPLTICDTGHNPEGIQEVLYNISLTNYRHLHFVIGMVNDKDITKILAMLPKNATYYFCKPDIPRGLDANILKQQANSAGLTGEACSSVSTALEAARLNAGEDDLIFIGGSTFVVAEVV